MAVGLADMGSAGGFEGCKLIGKREHESAKRAKEGKETGEKKMKEKKMGSGHFLFPNFLFPNFLFAFFVLSRFRDPLARHFT